MEFRVLHVLHFSAWPRCRKQKRRILLLAHFVVSPLVRGRALAGCTSGAVPAGNLDTYVWPITSHRGKAAPRLFKEPKSNRAVY